GIAHRRTCDRTTFDHQVRLHAEEGRRPQDQVCEFPDLYGADLVRHALRNSRVDGVFCYVALDPRVVVTVAIAWQRAALRLHLMRCLPGTDYRLTDTTHGL